MVGVWMSLLTACLALWLSQLFHTSQTRAFCVDADQPCF